MRIQPASSFVEASVVPSHDMVFTPFRKDESDAKMDWAYRQLDKILLKGDVLEIPLTYGGPSATTYLAWLRKALATHGDNVYLQTRLTGNTLYVRKAIREGKGKSGKVKHVIT